MLRKRRYHNWLGPQVLAEIHSTVNRPQPLRGGPEWLTVGKIKPALFFMLSPPCTSILCLFSLVPLTPVDAHPHPFPGSPPPGTWKPHPPLSAPGSLLGLPPLSPLTALPLSPPSGVALPAPLPASFSRSPSALVFTLLLCSVFPYASLLSF